MVKKRDAVLQVYVTSEEKALIEEAARIAGLSAAAFARMLVLDALRTESRASSDRSSSLNEVPF